MISQLLKNVQNANINGDFSFETICDFDRHIELSIPNYKFICDSIISIIPNFIHKGGTIVDIGASTGKFVKQIKSKLSNIDLKVIGIDNSVNLVDKSGGIVMEYDLTKGLPIADLYTSLFTLQFLNNTERLNVLKGVYNKLKKDNSFIIAEKVYCDNGKMQDVLTFAYYDFKSKSFSSAEILRKQKDLRVLMNLKGEKEFIEELENVGFSVYHFFRAFNFLGVICLK